MSGKRDKVMIQLTKTCGACCGKIGGKVGLFHRGKYFGSNPQVCIQGWEQGVGITKVYSVQLTVDFSLYCEP